jgi:hypothetical protein
MGRRSGVRSTRNFGSGVDRASFTAVDANGNVIVAGTTTSFGQAKAVPAGGKSRMWVVGRSGVQSNVPDFVVKH